ncbi:hypothetical protein CCAX7_18520 [Capsulimonas corticalis]|uniref:Uncharacterized protein n=1 Tax=Capsulimonas corticalis TaxID=2219043 RepID=A0A402D5P8_9BACT|nr:hypothetical protein CCAX7_18520 [Capsulimonas corticalis]
MAAGLAAPRPQAVKKSPKTVTVVVDYVNIGSVEFNTAWNRVPKGKDHDAQLMAALMDAGGTDVKGAEVTTSDGQTGRAETKAMGHGTVIYEGKAQHVFLQTIYTTEATPRFLGDGSLSVHLKLAKIDTAQTPEKEKPLQDIVLTTATFRDGRTTLIDGDTSTKWRSGAGAQARVHEPWKQVIFVTATVNTPQVSP